MLCVIFFCFKQKTAYEMRISDWSSDVCSSDLQPLYVLHISQRHICHWVLGVAAFGTTAHFRTDKPPLPRQPVCHRLEVAGIPGEAGKTEYRRTVRCPLIVAIVQTKPIMLPPISVFIFRQARTFPKPEERRVVKECVSMCISRCAPYTYKKKK